MGFTNLLVLGSMAALAAGAESSSTPALVHFSGHAFTSTSMSLRSLMKVTKRQSTSQCDTFQTACDALCMDLTGTCCGLGTGAWCELGYNCVDNGCCPIGYDCVGDPTGCPDSSYGLCGDYCVPEGSACCDEATGSYCDAGTTCNLSRGTCDIGGSSSGGGGGGGSSGGGSDDTTLTCPLSTDELCGEWCIPAGGVCCEPLTGNYCDAGYTCNNISETCTPTSSGGSDDDEDDDDAVDNNTPEDDEDEEEEEPEDPPSTGSSSGGSSGGFPGGSSGNNDDVEDDREDDSASSSNNPPDISDDSDDTSGSDSNDTGSGSGGDVGAATLLSPGLLCLAPALFAFLL